MWTIEDKFKVKLGGNYYIDTPNLIEYKGEPLFELKRADNTGLLGISFNIYNEAGSKIAAVKEGRIYQGDKDAYSVEIGADRYTLTDRGTDRVICDIKKRAMAHPAELDVSVTLYTKDGFLIEATPEQTNLGGIVMRGNTMSGCRVGIGIN